jgi:hypothetical protein
LNYFAKCLTLPNNLENPPSIFRSPWLSHSLHPYQVNFMPQSFVQLSLRQLKTKLKQIHTFVCLVWLCCLEWCVYVVFFSIL